MKLQRLALLNCFYFLAAACGGGSSSDEGEANDTSGVYFAAEYRCGATPVQFAERGEGALLVVGEEVFELKPAISASGAKYETPGDPETYFWTKGDRAMLSVRGEAYPECYAAGSEPTAGAASRKSLPIATPFEAGGNEPGWHVEITEEQVELVLDYGERRASAPTPRPETRDGATRFSAPEEDIEILIRDELCLADGTGMPQPNAVTVNFAGKTYQGCGGDPASLLAGGEWVVEDIGGRGIIDSSRVTLNFGAGGRVTGRGSCNQYGATYEIGGEGISMGPIETTEMACAPALMTQEQRFYDILADAERFSFNDTGALLLYGANNETIVARR